MTHPDEHRFGTLKEEALRNTARIDPMGVKMNEGAMRLFVEPGLELLAMVGEPDTRCGSCAFRRGTIPASCVQTQADAIKAVLEGVAFMCHAHMNVNGVHDRKCHGWIAGRIAMDGETTTAPWPWADEIVASRGQAT